MVRIAPAMLLLGVFATANATQYWNYSDGGISVMSAGYSDEAKSIVHRLRRLDAAVTTALGIPSVPERLRTVVYALPRGDFDRVVGKHDYEAPSRFFPSPFENTILIENSSVNEGQFFDAYFGYTGSVLLSAYTFAYPTWFLRGLANLFGASKMSPGHVTIGAVGGRRAQVLSKRRLLPVRTFLAVAADDPRLRDPEFLELFDAQSWLLAHLIVVEGRYRENFYRYFALRNQGEDASKAFAASFDVAYDSLDKLLSDTLHVGRIAVLNVPVADAEESGTPTRLSESVARGRLAELASRFSANHDDALAFAHEALDLDAHDADALSALGRAQYVHADYAAALDTAERLCAPADATQALREAVLARCGRLFADLAISAALGKVGGADAAALHLRARDYLRQATTIDPDDLESMAPLGREHLHLRHREEDPSFLAIAEHTLARHTQCYSLAQVLTLLYAADGEYDQSLRLAEQWQDAAPTAAERARAAETLARIRGIEDRRNPAPPPPSP